MITFSLLNLVKFKGEYNQNKFNRPVGKGEFNPLCLLQNRT